MSDAQKQIFDRGIPYYNVDASTCDNQDASSVSGGSSSNTTGSGGNWLDPTTPSGANIQKVLNLLADMGFSGAQIAGFLGNLRQETGAINPASGDDGANGAGGGGIVQWSPGRLRQLSSGPEIWTIDYQLKLIQYELSGSYKQALSQPTKTVGAAFQGGTSPATAAMTSITDARTAAWAWDNFYEVGTNPGDARGNYAVAAWNSALTYTGTNPNGISGLSSGQSIQNITGDMSKLGASGTTASDSSTGSGDSCDTSTSSTASVDSNSLAQQFIAFINQKGGAFSTAGASGNVIGITTKRTGTCGNSAVDTSSGPACGQCTALSGWYINTKLGRDLNTNVVGQSGLGAGNGASVVTNMVSQGLGTYDSTPQAGDVFSSWGGQWSSSTGHTGIVTGVNGDTVTTLENWGSSGKLVTMTYSISQSKIVNGPASGTAGVNFLKLNQ